MVSTGYLLIGEVSKPHGLRGHVKIHSYASSPESFLPGRVVYLSRGQEIQEWMITETKIQGQSVLIKLKDLDKRQQAEALVGFSVYLHERQLKVLPEGEYYWYQLIGSRVYTDQNRFLGVMEGVLPTAAHDIWVVRNGVKEILLPAVEDVIISVSTMNKEIRVRDMDGLTESDDL